ncbi:MAG: DUF1844 domain-containing protein [Phycisphaerae bacterium]|jgi:hypothetical protein
MAEEKKEEKKIIIDEDWKKEAEKEKEQLAEEQEQPAERGPLPRGDFAALISMLTTQAFFSMGAFKIEGQDDREPDMELARYNIDMLETLEEKTKGNLTEQEEKVLQDTLGQLRMVFVKMSEAGEKK